MSALRPMSRKRQRAMEDGTFHKQFGKVRKPTGEIELLDRLIRERGPFSEISGAPLVEKDHPKYHWQLFHILGKGEYPELRLEDHNVILATPEEQDAWTNRKWTLKDKAQWKPVFEREVFFLMVRRPP